MKKLGIWLCVLLMLGTLPMGALAAEGEDAEIPVRVLAEGTVPEGGTYTVELWQEKTVLQRLTLEAGETGYLSIPLETTGVFDYRICQQTGENPSCTYDKGEYRLRLTVILDGEGRKQVTALLYGQEGEKVPAAVFRNHWAKPAEVTFRAWKTMDGDTPEDDAFIFRLLAEDGETVQQVKNDGRRVRFQPLTFDREGTYRFFLKEAAGKNRKILYDRTVYTATVTVTKETDYQARVTWERNGKPWTGTPSFANYTDTGSPKTGDTIGIWFGLLGISASALAVLLLRRRRR